jgi:hypothetical protein
MEKLGSIVGRIAARLRPADEEICETVAPVLLGADQGNLRGAAEVADSPVTGSLIDSDDARPDRGGAGVRDVLDKGGLAHGEEIARQPSANRVRVQFYARSARDVHIASAFWTSGARAG